MKRTVENVQRLIDEGNSINAVAKVFGITHTPMSRWIKANGVKVIPMGRRWTDGQLIDAVHDNLTMSDVLKKLGLAVRPGNYTSIKKHICRLGLSTQHFIGRAHGRTKPSNKRHLKDVLVRNSNYSRSSIKRRIIEEGLIVNVCNICGLTEWCREPIVLVLDHVNGISNDNRLENLQLLCPNCNSQQPTFCRKSKASQANQVEASV